MENGRVPLARNYDVVVVGGGPAGAATARALKGQGLKVVILEMKKLPRYKMCSGILFPGALRTLSGIYGGVPEEVLSHPSRCRGLRVFVDKESPMMEMPADLIDPERGSADSGLSVRRGDFDSWLCKESGTDLVDGCVFHDFREHGDDFTLKVEMDATYTELKTRYLVGADGCISRVRRIAFPGFDRKLRLIPNYEEWYLGTADLEPEWLYMFCDRSVTGFFATLFRKENHWIAVTGVQRGESVKDFHQRLIEYLKQKHGFHVEQREKSCGIVLHDMSATGSFCLGRGNVLLVGEAAGLNRCAEGITSALLSGTAAGECIIESMRSGEKAFQFYSRAIESEIQTIRSVNGLIEKALGYNPFTRE
ncbi:MAG: FAD-dependent oxidoreductase [bacterium]